MGPDEIKPIVLLADSQLLFWSDASGARFLERLRRLVSGDDPRAAYLGASNGDQPEFYELFRAAMAGVGLTRCRHVPAEPSINDQAFLESADLVLLAGGDPARGMDSFRRHGLDRVLFERHFAGALLIGVSAGAVQVGLRWSRGNGSGETQDMLRLAPFVIAAHDEPHWADLRRLVQDGGTAFTGLGVPRGGGALLHPDRSVEPVRHPLVLLEWRDGQVADGMVAPPAPGTGGGASGPAGDAAPLGGGPP